MIRGISVGFCFVIIDTIPGPLLPDERHFMAKLKLKLMHFVAGRRRQS